MILFDSTAPVKITRVDLDVAFNNTKPEDMKDRLNRVLRSIDADTDNLRVEASENKMVHAKFSLNGDNCAAVAFKIEQLVSISRY